MVRIVGLKSVSFKAQDGTQIEGYNFYLGSDVDPGKGVGLETEKIFVTRRKIADLLAVCPNAADLLELPVVVFYNRYGKVERIVPAE